MMMFVFMLMLMLVSVFVLVVVVMGRFEVDVELNAFDAGPVLARNMEVILMQTQFLKFPLEMMEIHSEINQGSEKHIAADAAENIEVNGFHLSSPAASALIWLAA